MTSSPSPSPADRVLTAHVGDDEAPHAEVVLGVADAVGEPVEHGAGDTVRGGSVGSTNISWYFRLPRYAVLERLVGGAGEVVASSTVEYASSTICRKS